MPVGAATANAPVEAAEARGGGGSPSPGRRGEGSSASSRFDGIDSFRVVGIYVVLLFHFHTEWAADVPLGLLVRLRGCAFPFVILASFFVVARSILCKPERGFRPFASARFRRIGMPFLLWTIIYWTLAAPLPALLRGDGLAPPPLTLPLSGYGHLWFLQFIFLGSLALYPALRFLAACGHGRRLRAALACLAVALAHGLWLRPVFERLIFVRLFEHIDGHLLTLLLQVNYYFAYVPFALAIALHADRISALYQRRAWRVLSLAAVALAMCVHLAGAAIPFTKGAYSLAVFVAMLRPMPASVVNFLRPVAAYSYLIYILHLLVSRGVVYAFGRAAVEPTLGSVLLGSVVVFGLTLLAAVAARRLFPHDWLLPLIPIRRRGRDAGAARRPETPHQALDHSAVGRAG